jgi:hypothetical protein
LVIYQEANIILKLLLWTYRVPISNGLSDSLYGDVS